MASVMPFPTVATHRRMPHLSKEPKGSKTQSDQASGLANNHDHDHDHELSPSVTTVNASNQALTLPTSENHQLAITSPNTAIEGQKFIQYDGQNNNDTSSQPRVALVVNTTTKTIDPINTPTVTSATTTKEAVALELVGDNNSATAHDQLAKQGDQHTASLLHGHHQHHASQQLSPLNAPHGSNSSVTTPLSALPPSGASPFSSASSSTLSLNESKLIKTALNDAFGCLYHPVQHTHPSTSNLSSAASTPPRASPMLRPHLVASAPITPLDLTSSSADGHIGGGYFGLHGSSSHLNGQSATGTPTRHLQAQHYHNHHTVKRASSLYHEDHYETDSNKSLSSRPSIEFNLDPVEHPVLCSLHTLSLTHPRPAEHYHPHLGHDLGHDCIPVISPTSVASAQTAKKQNILDGTQPPIQLERPPFSQKQQQQRRRQSKQQQQPPQIPLTPGELLCTNMTISNINGRKDHGGSSVSSSDGLESMIGLV
ncbi:hypothetical protein BGZ49_003107 [Haplosporangium sp. Z 27]|nr:hypothetical protein BGZ49_003107 [Haplosporangium sp. Z 27]